MEDVTVKVKIEGSAVEADGIEFRRLIQFGDVFQKLVDQFAASYLSEKDSTDVKPPKRDTALRLRTMEKGSVILILGLQNYHSLDLFNTGPKILQSLFLGLQAIEDQVNDLPREYNQEVLGLWRDLGGLLKDGIEKFNFNLNMPGFQSHISYDNDLHEKVIKRISSPKTRKRVLKGRFMIANFNPNTRSVRLYLEKGGFVRCVFNADMVEKVQESLRHHIRVWGTSTDDPTGKIKELKIKGITILRRAGEEIEEEKNVPAETSVEYATASEVEEISEYLLHKNRELYRRLAYGTKKGPFRKWNSPL